MKTQYSRLHLGWQSKIKVLLSTFLLIWLGILGPSTVKAQQQYPYDIFQVETDPDDIEGIKELDKLFDGIYTWPNTAIVHYVDHADVGVIIEFNEERTLEAFNVAVAGTDGVSSSYLWKVEKAAGWGEPLQLIRENYETTTEGMVNVPFGENHTAKVFKITADRNNGDGVVHLLELIPIFSSGGNQCPFSSIQVVVYKITRHGIVMESNDVSIIDGERITIEVFGDSQPSSCCIDIEIKGPNGFYINLQNGTSITLPALKIKRNRDDNSSYKIIATCGSLSDTLEVTVNKHNCN